MSFSAGDSNVTIAECSMKNEFPKVKKANFAVGSFSKTVNLENGTAILKGNKNELGGFFSIHGKDINGRQITCEMHHKLVQLALLIDSNLT